MVETKRAILNKRNKVPKDYYHDAYLKVMYTGIIGFYSKIVHTIMELGYNNSDKAILELGAGRGEHFPYVKPGYKSYTLSDIDIELLEGAFHGKPEKVDFLELNAETLEGIASNSYDRVIATCLLAHLTHPLNALSKWRDVLKDDGEIVIYVPSEPGMMLRLFRFLFVAPKSKKYGQNHMSVIARDHRNHYPAMRQYIRDVFSDDTIKTISFPFPFFGWNFNFFTLYKIKINKAS